MTKFAFIGAGNMGSILIRALNKKVPAENILVVEKNEEKILALQKDIAIREVSIEEAAQKADFVFLAIKPQQYKEICRDLDSHLTGNPDCTIISMLASVSLDDIRNEFTDERPVIRIMPNTPALVEEGMILYSCNSYVTEDKLREFQDAMQKAGKLEAIEENKIDAACALSGCGPAFVYIFAEALADAAVECGLSREQAYDLAAQTIYGSGKMLVESEKIPAQLKDEVCSPGGSTIAGVHALEDSAFRSAAMNAVQAAFEKSIKKSE